MASDHIEIMELLEHMDINKPSSYQQFASMRWQWKDDQNNNNYNTSNTLVSANTATTFPFVNQLIRIDTKDLIDMWVAYKQAFWFVPMSYTIGGTVAGHAFSAPTTSNGITPLAIVGIKNGLYQLIDGLQISINGVQLNKLNSKFLNMVNQWEAMIDFSVDYMLSVGEWSSVVKDTLQQQLNAPPQLNTAFPNNIYPNLGPYITGATGAAGQNNNYGFYSNQNILTSYNTSGGNDATQFTTVGISGMTGSNVPYPQLGITGPGAAGYAPIISIGDTGTSSIQLLSQLNANYNAGFFKRINLTNQTYVVNSNGVGLGTFNACIPLALINDFFRQLKLPLLGTQFYFQFTMANPSQSATQPFMVDASGPNAVVSSVMHSIAETLSVTIGNSSLNNTRLYYPQVTFNARTLEKLNPLLSHGFQREVVWYDNYVVPGNLNITATSNSQPNYNITPGISRPVRVIMLTPRSAQTAAPSSTVPINSVGINSCFDAAPAFSVGQFTNLQLLVDTVPLYPNQLIYDFEAYNMLKQEFVSEGLDPQDGSLISYSDFLTNYRYYVFNCSRMINALPDPAKQVSLQFIGTRIGGDNVAVDQYFIIEVEQSTLISFSSSRTVTI